MNLRMLFLMTGLWAAAATLVLVMLPAIASPKAKMFSNLSCWRVYWLTSIRPSAFVIPESTRVYHGLLGEVMLPWVKACSKVAPVSTSLKVAIFSPTELKWTLVSSWPKQTSIPLFLHSSKATSLAYGKAKMFLFGVKYWILAESWLRPCCLSCLKNDS